MEGVAQQSDSVDRQFELALHEEDEAGARPIDALGTNGNRIRVGEAVVRKLPRRDNAYPLSFTRAAVFSPLSVSEQYTRLSKSNGGYREVKTGYAEFRIYAPATTKDEDVLIALVRMREFQINGPRDLFDQYGFITKTAEHSQQEIQVLKELDEQRVHYLRCSYGDIERELGWKHGGRTRKDLQASLRRLNTLTIQMIAPGWGEVGLKLIDLKIRYMDDGDDYLQVTFPDWLIKQLVEKDKLVYLDPKTRRHLSPIGKKIYAFFRGQKNVMPISIAKLKNIVGYEGTDRNFKVRLRETLDKLQDGKEIPKMVRRWHLYPSRESKNGTLDMVEVIKVNANVREMQRARRQPSSRAKPSRMKRA